MEEMRRAIESNLDRLRPVVDSVFPLEQLRLISICCQESITVRLESRLL